MELRYPYTIRYLVFILYHPIVTGHGEHYLVLLYTYIRLQPGWSVEETHINAIYAPFNYKKIKSKYTVHCIMPSTIHHTAPFNKLVHALLLSPSFPNNAASACE